MSRTSFPRRARLAVAVFASVMAFGTLAYAQAAVVVEVRNPGGAPAEGEVTLTPEGGGPSYSCRTSAGRCELTNVPGGRYVATLHVAQGESPPPRPVMIPPAGRVTLRVSTR